jgi:hypothetical protein
MRTEICANEAMGAIAMESNIANAIFFTVVHLVAGLSVSGRRYVPRLLANNTVERREELQIRSEPRLVRFYYWAFLMRCTTLLTGVVSECAAMLDADHRNQL